jgi:hypothetical protein
VALLWPSGEVKLTRPLLLSLLLLLLLMWMLHLMLMTYVVLLGQ